MHTLHRCVRCTVSGFLGSFSFGGCFDWQPLGVVAGLMSVLSSQQSVSHASQRLSARTVLLSLVGSSFLLIVVCRVGARVYAVL